MRDYRSLVVRLTPRLKGWLLALSLLSLLSLLLLYRLGFSRGLDDAVQQVEENHVLRQQRITLQQALDLQQQQRARAEKQSEVDRLAMESLRQDLLAQRHELTALQSDVEFYRGLMAPDELRRGLGVHDFNWWYEADSDRHHYRFLATHADGKNALIKGVASLALSYQQDGVERRQSLGKLPQFDGDSPAKLRFRFFQKIAGSFKLPKDSTPVSMHLELKIKGRGSPRFEQRFVWRESMSEAVREVAQEVVPQAE